MRYIAILFLLSFTLLSAQQTAEYGWEDGVGTALGFYGNAVLENSDEQFYSGTYSLKISEDPLEGTPQAYIWWVTGLTDGDIIDASFWVYDINSQGEYPKGRIWGHYTELGGDVNSYSGSAGGNQTYTTEGWSILEWNWTFDSNGGVRDGFVVEARIYSEDPPNNVIYVDDATVTVSSNTAEIHSPAPPSEPTITVTSPNGGEEWEQGSSQDITWTSYNFTDNVKIELEMIDRHRDVLIPSTENDGSWQWDIPEDQPEDDWYVIIISNADDTDPWDASDEPFSIISSIPEESITITSPNGGENWYQGSNYDITWTSINYTGYIQIDLLSAGIFLETLASEIEDVGSWQWNIPEDQQIGESFTISIFDPQDNFPIDESDDFFSISEAAYLPDEGAIIVNEIMKNPAAVGDTSGEWFEIYNTTNEVINLNGWIIKDADTDYHVITADLPVPPESFLVLGVNDDFNTNGGVEIDYMYDDLILANGDDEVIICWIDGTTVIDEVYYNDADFPDPNGASMELKPEFMNYSDNDIGSNWQEAVEVYGDGDLGTPGEMNSGIVFPGTPENPYPQNGAQDIPVNVELTWANGEYTESIDLYFGTVNPPSELILDNVSPIEVYNPGLLDLNTTYFWQIVCRNQYGETQSEIWSFTTTATSADNELAPKTNYLGNFPNPFNPETTIKFHLSKAAFVNIRIFDLKGNLVKILKQENYPSGNHNVLWNGIDSKGNEVSSGIYIIKFSSGDYSLTSKMILIK
ncbi:MAG: hypothetical protein APR54_00965 [Candidatus Cloacimonas sp. SDB]|nr:MAG: hypothetical protein APR54_00965 [Candidatus Cloacimonas sp. SDB]